MAFDATWVMLGSGERRFEERLARAWRRAIPERVSTTIGFDERLAHLIEAGADLFLMPSRFEPCGLNQMYSLRYGTVPMVRATGGLDDTVVDVSRSGRGTGFKFSDYTPGSAGRHRAPRAGVFRSGRVAADPGRGWRRTTPGTFRPRSMSKCMRVRAAGRRLPMVEHPDPWWVERRNQHGI